MQRLKQKALVCLLAVGLAAPLAAQQVSLANQYYGSNVVSADWPEAVKCGESFTVDVTMVNASRRPWTEADFHKLGPVKGKDEVFRSDGALFKMPDGTEVPYLGQHTFTLELTAPDTEGTYDTEWSMMVKGTPYGIPIKRSIRVLCDDASLARAIFPERVACNLPFTAEVRMKNSGVSTWTEAEFYKLGPVLDTEEAFRPDGHKFKMPNGTEVPVGEKFAFELDLVAPDEPGIYQTKWTMMNSGRAFGEEVERLIKVVCGPGSELEEDGKD